MGSVKLHVSRRAYYVIYCNRTSQGKDPGSAHRNAGAPLHFSPSRAGSDRSGRYPAVTPNESLSERAQPPLKKFDPQRLRKNLDASKKKLAEKTTAADKLQKSLSQARSENSQLELKIKELEAQLEKASDQQGDQAPEEQEAA